MVAQTMQLSDLIFGDDYSAYSVEKSITLNAFSQSGVAVENSELTALAGGAGGTYNLPFFKQLAADDANVSSDDDSVLASKKKAATGTQSARLHMYNQVWSSADINKCMIAKDPLMEIANLTAGYWAGWRQKMIIQSALGIYADNVANDAGDMVIDQIQGAALANRQFTSNTMIDAGQTMGDAKTSLKAIACHSVVHADWQKQGALVSQFSNETGELLFETFQGKRVIVDDGMPVAAVVGAGAVSRATYASIIFGAGAIQTGTGTPKVGTEYEREARGGNGGGIENLIERRHPIVHPLGMKWLDASVAGISATKAELALAVNWDRAYNRKNVMMAFVRSTVV